MHLKWTLQLFSILLLLQIGNPAAFGQENAKDLKLKGNFQNKPLDLVLLDLQLSYRLDFEFDLKQVREYRVTASFNGKSLGETMGIILLRTDLDFEILGPGLVKIAQKTQKKSAVRGGPAPQPTSFNLTVSGQVRDKHSGETLPFANVLVKGTTNGAPTNVDGYFTLFDVPSDTSSLEVQYIGYRTQTIFLHPEMDLKNLIIEMEDYSQLLEEVIVLAERKEQLIQASTGVSKIGFSPAQMAALPSYGERDIFRSLQLLPGVSGSNESSSGLYVRGGTPDQNLVLFDGFTVYHVDHLFGFFSAFNANAIKDVQLHKGGFDAKFGGRLSSVVELTGKDGNTEAFNAGVGFSLLSVNGFVEAPFAKGKGSFLLAGRRSFQSNFYDNIFEAFTQTNQAAADVPQPPGGRFGQQQIQPNSYFYDLNAKLTYRLGNKDVFSLSFYNGQDDLDNSRNFDQNSLGGFAGRFGGNRNVDLNFLSNNTDLTNWDNWGASMKWSRRWNDRLYTNANLSYSNYYSERDRRNATTITRSDSIITRTGGSYEYNDLRDLTFKMDNEWKLSKDNQLEFGLQATYNDIAYEFTQNDTSTLINRDDQGLTASIYIQDKHTFADRLILKGGLRTSYYDVTGKSYFEPRASLSYLLTDRFKLKAAWGKYYQFATRVVREDIQQGSRDFWLLANDETAPVSSATHYIAGLSYETPDWLFDVEGYYKPLEGLTEYTTRFSLGGGGSPPGGPGSGSGWTLDYEEFFYQGTGVAQGLEFLLQKKAGKFTGWIGYTLGQVKYDFEAFGDQPFYANQDQTHELKLVGNYKLRNWTFGATFIYATGRPYTAPTGFYEIELLDGSIADYFEVSDKNALRFPDYHRFDVSATYNFKLGSSKASAGLSLFNVYGRKNVWYKEYEVIEGELIETDVSLLGFTPSLFVTWSLR